MIPDPPKSTNPLAAERVQKDRKEARRLFTQGQGNDLPGVAGTLWAAYNGVTEMVDCGRNRRTAEQHLDHTWFGGGYSLKARAFETARKPMATERKVG